MPPQNKASYAVNVSFIGLLPLLLGLKDILSIRKVYLWGIDVFQKAVPVTDAYSSSDQLMIKPCRNAYFSPLTVGSSGIIVTL